jgi:hypothetical protein
MDFDFEAAAEQFAKADDSTLSRVSRLVKILQGLYISKGEIETQLKQITEAIRVVENEDIPTVLAEAGVKKITTLDDIEVVVSPFYAASIPKDRTEEAFEWLRTHGHGDLVKNIVSVQFGRQEDDKARNLVEQLNNAGLPVNNTQKVEPMTLKAFVKEQMEGGSDFPEELFGVYHGSKATLKQKVRK